MEHSLWVICGRLSILIPSTDPSLTEAVEERTPSFIRKTEHWICGAGPLYWLKETTLPHNLIINIWSLATLKWYWPCPSDGSTLTLSMAWHLLLSRWFLTWVRIPKGNSKSQVTLWTGKLSLPSDCVRADGNSPVRAVDNCLQLRSIQGREHGELAFQNRKLYLPGDKNYPR